MSDTPEPPDQRQLPAPAYGLPPVRAEAEPQEEPEPELTLAHYFGGCAIIFIGMIGLALAFVLITKLMR
jgi:hypothetical protein